MMKLSILLIEDTLGDAILFEETLDLISCQFGIEFDLKVARTLADAKTAAQEDDVSLDAIFLDLGLPDAVEYTGLEVMKKEAPETPIIVLTGYQDISRSIEYIEKGASDYLDKVHLNPDNLYRATRYAIERKKSAIELTRLARTDPLTKLANRRVFEEAIETLNESAHRSDKVAAVLICDLDDFKYINDNYGHQVGDELLCQISERLTASLRKTDLVARLGGDEFGILLSNLPSGEGALQATQKVYDAVTSTTYAVGGLEVFINFSIGLAAIGNEAISTSTIIARADAAMYKAKNSDGASVVIFDDLLKSEERSTVKLKKAMAADMGRNSFLVHYQPIVDAQTHEVVSVEALARWRDLTGTLIPPAVFIPVAEQANLIDGITLFNLKRICSDIVRWRNLGLSVPMVSINLSPTQFKDNLFVDRFVRTIIQSGIEPNLFQVEILEAAAVQNMDLAQEIVTSFQSHGVKVYLDNFGKGSSSLSVLRKLPIDGIKIDKSLVLGVNQDATDFQILEGIVSLANKINITTIIEGVETAELAEAVEKLGATQLQGFHFAVPMLGSTFSQSLADTSLKRLLSRTITGYV